MELLERIKTLCALSGISGREDAVRREIIGMIDGHCSWHVDPLGNLIAEKRGRQTLPQRLLFSAHMDEVGFMVTRIGEDGLLQFSAVGGVDSRVVVGKPVRVGESGIPGVIGTKPVHLQDAEERGKAPALDSLYIDIGAADAAQAREHAAPGDPVVFDAPVFELGSNKLCGKAIDDRAGCALLVELLLGEPEYDCTVAFTVQEETGCIGGGTAAYGVQPDWAVAVETTTAADLAGVAPEKRVCVLGNGPVISYMDRGTIYHAAFYRYATELAQRAGIPWQTKEGIYGGNEARAVQTAAAGTRVLAVSLPCRYLHSPGVVMQNSDAQQALSLLQAIANQPPCIGQAR